MRFLFILFILFSVTSCDFKEKISGKSSQITREQVLKKFKKNFSDVIPSDVILSVSSFKDSPLEGLKEGVILFKSLDSTQQLSFLITHDGNYIIFNPEIYNLSGPKRNEEILSKINLDKIPYKGNPRSKITIVEYYVMIMYFLMIMGLMSVWPIWPQNHHIVAISPCAHAPGS